MFDLSFVNEQARQGNQRDNQKQFIQDCFQIQSHGVKIQKNP
jgi:hypothetical protein